MPFAQINAAPNNGQVTIYRRGGSFYKTTGGKLPAARITSQLEIDAINKNMHVTEFYDVAVEQLATLLGKTPSDVLYPPIGEADNIDFTTTNAADGVTLAIDSNPNAQSIVVRIGVVGHDGADMHIAATGAFDLGTEIAGHTIAAGDRLSVTFAYFAGSYTTVDEALTSLEAWEWATPYAGYTVPATA